MAAKIDGDEEKIEKLRQAERNHIKDPNINSIWHSLSLYAMTENSEERQACMSSLNEQGIDKDEANEHINSIAGAHRLSRNFFR